MSANFSAKNNAPSLDLSPEEASQLAQQLKDQILRGALQTKEQETINLMIAGLGDKNGLTRRAFSESLGIIGKTALPGLLNALRDNQNVTVRRAAAKTIKLVGDASALPYLLEALMNDQDPVVQGSSAGAMAIFGEDAVDHLLEVLRNPFSSSMQCGLASWALAFIGSNAPKGVKKAAQSKNPIIRTAAIGALEDLIKSSDDPESKSLLLKALKDPVPEVRVEATRLIINLNDGIKVEKLLLNKLNDNELIVRKNAVLALMKLKSKNSIQTLKSLLLKEVDSSMINIIQLAINLIANK